MARCWKAAPYTARQFARAIVMPNLSPPMTDVAGVAAYRERILAALPADSDFTPLMTLYLTDHTDPDEVERGHSAGVFTAAKLYPAHATTGSAHGVTSVATIYPVLERMQKIGMPLLIHGEVTDSMSTSSTARRCSSSARCAAWWPISRR
jgi:dihydroorotase